MRHFHKSRNIQSELAEFLSQYQYMSDSEGKPLVVRNSYLPQRELMTGIGPVDIKVPKTRDRGGKVFTFDQSYYLRISNEQRT